jgi:hypothetical protein
MEEHKRAIFVLALALLAATRQKPETALKEAFICAVSNFYVPTTP